MSAAQGAAGHAAPGLAASRPTGLLLTQPTGSGKTYQARQQAAEALRAQPGNKVLVLVPLKALAAEVSAEWTAALPDFTVQHYTSDTRKARAYAQADVLIMTAERLDLLSRNWRRHNHWLARLDLVIVDEVHFLGDASRGARLDAALTRLRAAAPLIRLMAMSATVGDPEALAGWMQAEHRHSDRRPVPLHWEICRVRTAADKPVKLPSLIGNEPTLIFVNARKRSEELSALLRNAGIAAEHHHAGLSQEERTRREDAFRHGTLSTLVATSGVECGLNFPATHVILYDLTLYQHRTATPVSVVSAWQRGGRAGRVAGGPDGRVTLLATGREQPELYLGGNFEALRSPLGNALELQDFTLGSIDAGMAHSRAQMRRLLSGTFAAYAGPVGGEEALEDLISQGGVAEVDGRLSVTPLGRVASAHLLPVRAVSCLRFLPDDYTVMDALLIACASALPGLPRMPDTAWALLEPALSLTPSVLLDQGQPYGSEVQFAVSLLLSACLNGDDEAAQAYALYTPDVAALRAGAARVLTAWCDYRPDAQKLRLICTMLTAGVSLGAATLTLLPGVGAATARRLAHHGVEDIEALAASSAEDLSGLMGLQRARAIILAAETRVKTFEVDVCREVPPQPREALPLDWRARIDPVRLYRALSLNVCPQGEDFLVSGGDQPHRVSAALHCDCQDHTRTRRCKHVLAVERQRGDPDVLRNIGLLC